MYFEDFTEGKQTFTPEKTITLAALESFVEVSGLCLPMFLSDENARKLGHNRRLVPGPMVLSLTMGLVKEAGWFDHVVAVIEFSRLRFLKTVHPDQTIKAQITVKQTKATKNQGRGFVLLGYEVFNEDGEKILAADGKYLMQTRPHEFGEIEDESPFNPCQFNP